MVNITAKCIDMLRAEAGKTHPQECCGILLGRGEWITEILTARNVHPDPRQNFEIDPQALVDAHRNERGGGPQIVGYYHSHPNGVAIPSATDREQAARQGKVWAIVAGKQVSLWRDALAGFLPLSYTVADA